MTAVNTLNRQQLTKLAEQAAFLAEWTTARDFATQMYGEGKAVKVEFETYEEYDDENYSYPLGEIVAYGADGKELEYDHSLPFFSTKAWQSEARYDHSNDFNVFKNITVPEDEEQRSAWIFFEDLPDDDATYDLTVQPVLTLPA